MKMSDKSIPVDTGHVDDTVKQKKDCYRCDNLSLVDEMKLNEHLCNNCYDDMRELGRAVSQSDSVKLRGTQVYKATPDDGDRFWMIYHPERGDDIMEIARNFERNLIPVNVFQIQMQQKTGYLLTLQSVTDRSVPILMEIIDPRVSITNFKRIVDTQTPYQIAAGRALSDFILGKPCGNKLELTFREYEEMMIYSSDMEKSGLRGFKIAEKVLEQFYVSDPITRKAALIGIICERGPDLIKKADAKPIPENDGT